MTVQLRMRMVQVIQLMVGILKGICCIEELLLMLFLCFVVAPVVAAPAVPTHLAPFVIGNGKFGLSPFHLGVSHAPVPIHWIPFSENGVQCWNDELYMHVKFLLGTG